MAHRRKLVPWLLLVCLVVSLPASAQLRQIAIIDVPGHPGFDSMVFAGNCLVMAHTAASTVDVFDPAKRRLITRIQNMGEPRGLAVDDQGRKVFVANSAANTISVISVGDWNVIETIPLALSPEALLLSGNGATLYIANWHDSSISAMSVADHRLQTVALNSRPEDLALDREAKLLYVTLEDSNQVVALDPALQPVKKFPLNASMPTGLALDPRARRIFVAVRYAVLVLDSDDGHELGRIPAPAGADKLWFDDAGATLYAASHGGAVTVIRQQGSRYVAEQELDTKVRGHSIAFDPARGLAYVPGGFEGRSKLVILKRLQPAPPRTASANLR
jgi:YVTN family beta-propeller protein